MRKRIDVSNDAVTVLRDCAVTGNVLTLPPGQLDRRVYVEVNKALEAIGGKWNRGAGGHVFPEGSDPASRLAELLDTGEATGAAGAGYFPTPEPLVSRLIELARIEPHHLVLEPSAGQGAIADAVAVIVGRDQLHLVEALPENCAVLTAKGYTPVHADFMAVDGLPLFDRVVMNPPFARRQDIAHARRAFGMLRPGGRLVSVMAAGVDFRDDRVSVEFREFIAAHGSLERNPLDSFAASGTSVNTITVAVDKPAVASLEQLELAA